MRLTLPCAAPPTLCLTSRTHPAPPTPRPSARASSSDPAAGPAGTGRSDTPPPRRSPTRGPHEHPPRAAAGPATTIPPTRPERSRPTLVRLDPRVGPVLVPRSGIASSRPGPGRRTAPPGSPCPTARACSAAATNLSRSASLGADQPAGHRLAVQLEQPAGVLQVLGPDVGQARGRERLRLPLPRPPDLNPSRPAGGGFLVLSLS